MIHAGIAKVKVESLYVDAYGKISGPGTKTLAKTRKNIKS